MTRIIIIIIIITIIIIVIIIIVRSKRLGCEWTNVDDRGRDGWGSAINSASTSEE